MAYIGPPYRVSTVQSVAYTGTAGTITNAIGSETYVVRVLATTVAFVSFTGTATTADVYMPAGVAEYFVVTPGQKVSAIQSASGGTLYVTEMTR